MLTSYATNRLALNVLPPEKAGLVLNFYEKNSRFLEAYEPKRTGKFYTLEFQRANMKCEYSAFIKHSHIRYWMFLKDDPDKIIGTVCFSHVLKGAFLSCRLGYKLDEDFCGMGYMQEALVKLIPLACMEIPVRRIEAMVMPDNLASINLLARLHFIKEGYLHSYAQINGVWQDHLLYAYINS